MKKKILGLLLSVSLMFGTVGVMPASAGGVSCSHPNQALHVIPGFSNWAHSVGTFVQGKITYKTFRTYKFVNDEFSGWVYQYTITKNCGTAA